MKKIDERISFLDQLQKCKVSNDTVEILTDTREIAGQVSVIGTDYVGIITAVERTIQTASTGQDDTVEKDNHVVVYELETFLKFEEIKAVSKVLRAVSK